MEPQILQTYLRNFRYNSIENRGPILIDWWLLDEDEEARGFTPEELKLFQNYTVNKLNFNGDKNAFNASTGGEPYIDEYDADMEGSSPTMFILRKVPELDGSLFRFTDIILTDGQGNDRHKYDLPFEVIGKIAS